MNTGFVRPAVATVLTACGIETNLAPILRLFVFIVATVLTACGIETNNKDRVLAMTFRCNSTYRLRY